MFSPAGAGQSIAVVDKSGKVVSTVCLSLGAFVKLMFDL